MEQHQEKLSMFEIFDNRRRFPRLKMDLPITITGLSGKIFRATLYDISPDGVQVRYVASDGVNIFPDKGSSVEDIKSLECILQFDLAYSGAVTHVNINAYLVCLRPLDEVTLAAGMFFSEKELVENKKISDFLFHQLQVSFSDIEHIQKNNEGIEIKSEPTIRRTVVENKKQVDAPEIEMLIPSELEELILQIDSDPSKAQLEFFKQLLHRILTGLKAIQETTRHIDERIHIIENKISKRH